LKRAPQPNPQLRLRLPKLESIWVVKSVGVVTLTIGMNREVLGNENLDFAVLKLIWGAWGACGESERLLLLAVSVAI